MSPVSRFGRHSARAAAAFLAIGLLTTACTSTSGAPEVTVTVNDTTAASPAGSDQTTTLTPSLPSLTSSAQPPSSAPVVPAPTITAEPALGSKNLSPSAPVTITVADGTIENLTLTNPAGKQVKGEIAQDKRSWKLGEVLGYGKTYTVDGTALSADGRPSPIKGTFTTLPESVKATTYITPGDDATVGIAQPVIINLPVAANAKVDRAAIEKRLSITTEPEVEGAWGWVGHDTGLGVDWRPKDYWPAGTKVTVKANLYGVKIADGKYGAEDLSVSFTIGRAQVTYADVNSHQIVVKQGCTKANDPDSCDKTIATYPASFGSGSNDNNVTRSGIHVVNDKFEDKIMTGTPPANYRVREKWAVRISNNGEFIHENPNTVADQGNTNVSNGCINLSPENAPKYFNATILGDPVEVVGSRIKLSEADGDIFDWAIAWSEWQNLSAL